MASSSGIRTLLLSCLLILGGCKIVIVAPPYHGSLVSSLSAAYECSWEEGTCEINVVDLFFDETFTVSPNFGYEFARWSARERGLCGGKVDECRLYTADLEGRDKLLAVLESDQTFFLEAELVPLRGREDQMNTVGLWQATDSKAGCTASYTVEIWIKPGVGLFTQVVTPAEMILVREDGSCRIVVATATNPRGPMWAVQVPLVTQQELQAGWDSVAPGSEATILGRDSWQLLRPDPAGDRLQVYTRI